MQQLEEIERIDNPVKRRAFFIGLLTEEIRNRGGKPPIVVGGEALEIYTQGSYTTGDIDIKAPRGILEEILREWDFTKKGRIWFNKALDIYIDWLGEGPDEGREAEDRVNTIVINDRLEIKIISIEDLIIDRLNAAKWWKDEDSLVWARVLVQVKTAFGEDIDREYLMKRAEQEQVEDFLVELLSKRD